MNKYVGFMLVSFVTGFVIPVVFSSLVLINLISIRPAIEEVEGKELPATAIELFCVDYDMYGNYIIGSETISCEITNDISNIYLCDVYLADISGSSLSERMKLNPGDTITNINTTIRNDTPGIIDCLLIYVVNVENDYTKIECPYKITVNGGF